MSNWYLTLKQVEAGRLRDIGVGIGSVVLPLGALSFPNPDLPEKPHKAPSAQVSKISPAIKPTPLYIDQPKVNSATTKKSKSPNILVARIIFSEAASVSPSERELVAGVIKNRVGNKAFGGSQDMSGVVSQKNAFEALGDSKNKNWAKTENPDGFSPKEQSIWQQCLDLSSGDIPEAKGPSGRPLVYYHDKSISQPSGWTNKYWKAVKEVETPHFFFYSVTPNQ